MVCFFQVEDIKAFHLGVLAEKCCEVKMILLKEQLEKPQGLNSRPGVALTHSEKLQGVFSALLSGQCEGSDR